MGQESRDIHADAIASGVGEAWALHDKETTMDVIVLELKETSPTVEERLDKLEEAVREMYLLHGREPNA
jgi:hypothetical protein